MPEARFRRAACDAEIREHALYGIDLDDVPVLLVRLRDVIHALGRICTHEYADLADGELEDGCVVCPLHGSKFDVVTGQALTLPAFLPEPVYEVLVEDGIVYVATDSATA
jgi:3-phenylpropionate/trans-cinnamate dioxygenase ferredoxin subunit